MDYRMKTSGPLWEISGHEQTPIRIVNSQIRLEAINDSPDNVWLNVRAHFPLTPNNPLVCWVLLKDVAQDDAQPKVPINRRNFVKYCTITARVVNAANEVTPYRVDRDYLIALADVLSEIKNIAAADSDSTAFGPYQLTEQEWASFLDQGDNREHYSASDRFDPLQQIDAAATRTLADASALGEALANAQGGSGPYVANSMDLFLAWMLGAPAAILIVKNVNAGAADLSVAERLSGHGLDTSALENRFSRFLKPIATLPVSELLNRIQKAFDSGLKAAFKSVKDETPEDLPVIEKEARAPWLEVARHEQNQGIAEQGEASPNPRILEYLRAAGVDTSKEVPWCAAFVTYCIKNSGVEEIAASTPSSGAALAVTWKRWGEQLPLRTSNIPQGAVIVLSPVEASDRSGHVGFFVAADGASNTITLLGGNQSNRVKESTYARSRVVSICWMNTQPVAETASAVDATKLVGPLDNQVWRIYLDVLGERESSNDYQCVNDFGYCGRWQFGALALIDLGYVRPGSKDKDLQNPTAWIGKNGIDSRDAWLAAKEAQDQAMLDYTQMNYRTLRRINAIKAAASTPHTAGLLAAAHLKGPGNAKKLVNGTVTSDALGTSTLSYYRLLSEALGGTGEVES